MLGRTFTLVATNVPFLSRGNHGEVLRRYADQHSSVSKNDLATMFLERIVEFTNGGGSGALVTPYNWYFLGAYKNFRKICSIRLDLISLATLEQRASRHRCGISTSG